MSQASSDLQYITLDGKGYSRLVRINKNTRGPPLSESKSLGGALQHVDCRCNSGLLLQQDLVVLWGEPKGLQGRPMSRVSKAGWGCSSKPYKAYGLKGFLLLALQAPSAPWTLAFFPPYFRLALVHQARAAALPRGRRLQPESVLKSQRVWRPLRLHVLQWDLAAMTSAAVPENPRPLPNSLPTCAEKKQLPVARKIK